MQQEGLLQKTLTLQEVQVYVQVKNSLANIPYLSFLPRKIREEDVVQDALEVYLGSIFSGLLLMISRYAITPSCILKNMCMERSSLDCFILSDTFFLFYFPLPFSFPCSCAAPNGNKSVSHKGTFSLIQYITALHAQPQQGSLTLDLCHQEHPILWPVLRPKGTLQTSCSLFPPGTKLWLCYYPLKMCGSTLKH